MYQRFIIKNHLPFYWEIICSIHYLHFSFEKHLPFKFWEISLLKIYKVLPALFSQRFLEIYLSRVINYWGSIFTLSLTWGAFSFFFLSSFFFLFLSIFSWQTLTIHWIARNGEEIIIFLVSSSRFLPFLFNWSVCNYQIDSWWDL